MIERSEQVRVVFCMALLCYIAGIFTFALWPTSDINWVEWVCAVAAVVAAIGLAAYVSPTIHLPYEEYAYLVCGFAGFTTLLLYLINTGDSPHERVQFTLLFGSGVIAGYGAFLAED